MPEFYIIIARKIFFPNFRGHVSPPAPVSYSHDYTYTYLFVYKRLA